MRAIKPGYEPDDGPIRIIALCIVIAVLLLAFAVKRGAQPTNKKQPHETTQRNPAR